MPGTTDDLNPATAVDEPDTDVQMAPELVFTTKAKDRPKSEVPPTPVEVDGEVFTACRPADDSCALLAAAVARSMPAPEQIAPVMRFLDTSLDEMAAALRRPSSGDG